MLRVAGSGVIPAELIKCVTQKLVTMLANTFRRYINGEHILQEWTDGWQISVYKKGNRQECKNYRGITVTSKMSRLHGKIVREFFNEDYMLFQPEEQNGSRAG